MNADFNLLDRPDVFAAIAPEAVDQVPKEVRDAFVDWASAKMRLHLANESHPLLAENLQRAAKRLCHKIRPRRTGPSLCEARRQLEGLLGTGRATCDLHDLSQKLKPTIDLLCEGYPDTTDYVYRDTAETLSSLAKRGSVWFESSGAGQGNQKILDYLALEDPRHRSLQTALNSGKVDGFLDRSVRDAISLIQSDAYGEHRLARGLPPGSPSGSWIDIAITIAIFVVTGCSMIFRPASTRDSDDALGFTACLFSGGLSTIFGITPSSSSTGI